MTDQVTDRKTGRLGDRRTPAYEVIRQQGRTTLHVRSYDIARAILKAPGDAARDHLEHGIPGAGGADRSGQRARASFARCTRCVSSG